MLAGATVAALAVDREHPLYVVKLGAAGYGFLVPIFFIVTGVNLNSPALVANYKSLALVPLLFAAMLVVKTAPATHYGLRLPARALPLPGAGMTVEEFASAWPLA